MTRQNTKSKKGFTIIEVVLVLAIAGLIFLMVFIAFPALQRSQHDTQRTDDMARVQAALINWQNNHSNNLPGASKFDATATGNEDSGNFVADTGEITRCGTYDEDGNKTASNPACEFVRDYMNAAKSTTTTDKKNLNTFKDPDNEYYNIVITANAATTKNPGDSFTNKDYDATMTLEVDGDIYTLSGERDAYAMFIVPGATCEEDHAKRSTKNNFAVLYQLEGSGVKCTNNGS